MKERKKKKLLAIAALLALVAVISGTFAWITSQQQRINRVESAAVVDDSVTVNEKWEPKPMVPGTEATKEVSVTNTGNANVFVRVSYEEVLKHLASEGVVSHGDKDVAGAKYDPDAIHTLTSHVPVKYSKDKISATNGFSEVTATQIQGLEAKTKLFVKGGLTIDPTTSERSVSYEAIVVHEYATEEYQAMQYTVSPTEAIADRAVSASDWEFEVRDLRYSYYEGGYENAVVNWAKSSLPNKDNTLTGHALLGTKGNRHGVDYDYTIETLGVSPIPAPSAATDADQIPLANNDVKGVQADKKGLNKNHIRIGYGVDITTVAALTETKWVYNKDDGWFYFTEPLKPSVTTPDLLKKLIYDKDLGSEYTNATYDLVVKMEAIQATEEALKDSAGWDLEGATTDSDTDKIVQQLVARIGA
ncbi:hypothetical protein [Candidatus Enterococcus ferrettii]|uniref:Alternate signal-mediated exported protein n=1 Tax=Candidatus Enterococcus ferrettii TaxID=2815324 RepID=A0ABV0ELY5_9ENTE|nr:hypothetical protein [Enterococcus sp. 665A]MBO1341238.1 hypothetical protein [Enterococcus sp. 665A]